MALSGELGDLSLAELIEFFGNLRKTGRLKVEFPEGPGVFYFREGDLVDAQVGQRIGPEAVYYALSMPNASFDFNTHIYASRQTINEPWMRLVLEGLRRVDEGIPPEQILADDHERGDETRAAGDQSIAEVVAQMDDLDRLEDGTWAITSSTERSSQPENKSNSTAVPPIFATATAATATTAGNRKKFALFAGIAAFLVCGTAVAALTNWFSKGTANTAAPAAVVQPPALVAPEANQPPAPAQSNANPENTAAENTQSEQQAALAAERRAAERRAAAARAALTLAPREERPAAATGSKTVMVQVTVDENGRVSQASVSNSRPGMESYEASALRIARQRRYPAGKSGVISVPVKIN